MKKFNFIEKFTTKEDLSALKKTRNAEFEFQRIGMTQQERQDAFGDLTPDSVARLCVLGDKKVPQTPDEWRQLAKKSQELSKGISGKDDEPKNST